MPPDERGAPESIERVLDLIGAALSNLRRADRTGVYRAAELDIRVVSYPPIYADGDGRAPLDSPAPTTDEPGVNGVVPKHLPQSQFRPARKSLLSKRFPSPTLRAGNFF